MERVQRHTLLHWRAKLDIWPVGPQCGHTSSTNGGHHFCADVALVGFSAFQPMYRTHLTHKECVLCAGRLPDLQGRPLALHSAHTDSITEAVGTHFGAEASAKGVAQCRARPCFKHLGDSSDLSRLLLVQRESSVLDGGTTRRISGLPKTRKAGQHVYLPHPKGATARPVWRNLPIT